MKIDIRGTIISLFFLSIIVIGVLAILGALWGIYYVVAIKIMLSIIWVLIAAGILDFLYNDILR